MTEDTTHIYSGTFYASTFPEPLTIAHAELSCNRVFREPDCGYTGPETHCDKSSARCAALGNAHRWNGWKVRLR